MAGNASVARVFILPARPAADGLRAAAERAWMARASKCSVSKQHPEVTCGLRKPQRRVALSSTPARSRNSRQANLTHREFQERHEGEPTSASTIFEARAATAPGAFFMPITTRIMAPPLRKRHRGRRR